MKKTVRLIPLLLAVLLLFTACAVPSNSQRGKELGYFNYPGLDWGMTKADFFKAMEKSESDFTLTASNDPLLELYTLTDVAFLEEPAVEICWTFRKLNEDSESLLSGTTVVYSGEIELNSIIEKLEALVKSQDVFVTDGLMERTRFEGENMRNVFNDEALYAEGATAVWVKYGLESTATVSTLPEELRSSAKKGYEAFFSDRTLLAPFDDTYADTSLSSASIWYICQMNEAGEKENTIFTLTLSGSIASIDAYADFAE